MKPLLLAVTFLTRLPIPVHGPVEERDLAFAARWFPLVGLGVGGLLGAVEGLGSAAIGPLAGPALTLLVMALVTGGLHLDGTADTVDGLAGGGDRERTLEIMKDSRVGAFGALALVLDLLIRFALLSSMNPGARFLALVGSTVAGKAAMLYAVARFPYARATPGLGTAFAGRLSRREMLFAGSLTVAIGALLMAMGGGAAIFALGLAMGVGGVSAHRLSRRLGGLTGDTFGFINEVGEISALLAWACRWPL